MARPIIPIAERFWKYVSKTDGCWLWTGSAPHGYGSMTINKRRVKATHVSWKLHGRDLPKGKWLLHKCDNPPCVNPDHLFVGDHAANTADKMAKGRHRGPRGERCAQHILDLDRVQKIRTLYATTKIKVSELAVQFSVTRGTIKSIVQGLNWKHFPWPSEEILKLARQRADRWARGHAK